MKYRLIPLLIFIGIATMILVAAWRADGADRPWKVIVSSDSYIQIPGMNGHLHWGSQVNDQDFVDAMNEAHERRTHPKKPEKIYLRKGCFMDEKYDIYCLDPSSGLTPEDKK